MYSVNRAWALLYRMTRTFRHPRRVQIAGAFLIMIVLAVVLLWIASGAPDYAQSLALELGAGIVGSVLTILLITPILRRAQSGRVREHSHLDYDWYTEQVLGATAYVKVLDTFSNLLDQPSTQQFLDAVAAALGRQAFVQILLLDPDSHAVTQRADELGQSPSPGDVRREILRNLRTLHAFERRLPKRERRQFEVRLYNATAGITLYRWDDHALVSFLSIGRLSGQGPQLQVTMSSPLGGFVEQRFDELWRHSRPAEEFLHLGVTLIEATGTRRDFVCHYVDVDGARYLSDPEIITEMARRRVGELRAVCPPDRTRYELVLVDFTDATLGTTLSDGFADKYGNNQKTFIQMVPDVATE